MKSQPNLLIVEDEVILAELLKQILTQQGYRKIDMANDFSTGRTFIRNKKYDLTFLDIRLGASTEGIELATIIQEESNGKFIFITAQSDPQIIQRAINTSPMAYLTKPFKRADVLAATSLALQSMQDRKMITAKNGWSVVRIPCDEIMYVQSDGNYIQLHTKKKQYTLRYTLEWFLEEVSDLQFCRIHRSCIINPDFLESFDRQTAIVGGVTLKISQKYSEDLRSVIHYLQTQ